MKKLSHIDHIRFTSAKLLAVRMRQRIARLKIQDLIDKQG